MKPMVKLQILLAVLAAPGCAAVARTLTSREAVVPYAGTNAPRRCSPECAVTERCDLETRTCVPRPCGGRCLDTQQCDESGLVPRCVARSP